MSTVHGVNCRSQEGGETEPLTITVGTVIMVVCVINFIPEHPADQ